MTERPAPERAQRPTKARALVLRALPRDLLLVLSQRLWQAGAGLITTVLAVHFLSAELQGWYYSFLSVAALYTLFDLGLSTVLVQVAAHTFSGLRWRADFTVEGEGADHFRALVGRASRWYVISAIAFAALLLPGGLLFFGSKTGAAPHWLAQWIVLCGVTAAGLVFMPFLSVLEGTGRITEVYAIRLGTAICGSLAAWAALAAGASLWATVMVPTATLLIPIAWLVSYRRELIVMAWRTVGRDFAWRREVWPLQWRLAVNWLCGYLLTQINTPVLFHTQGAVVAGQFGLSLTIVNTISLVAQSWLTRRVPAMARAAAQRDWAALDRLFVRDYAVSSAVAIAGAAATLAAYRLLSHTAYVHRVLPFWELTALLGFMLANLLIGGLSTHLRSYRKEPLMPLIAATTLVSTPVLIWAAARHSSAGLVAVLAAVNICVNLPVSVAIWRHCNHTWRHQA
ncbi:hypothetical protein [Trinickia diaoshuihuensis]|uniref:hypothetical protein n=1 Tax=Trinickia diaoshuihuensis TaxID=2292265 RepID=UPI0013C2E197|nr:hypothetical protein [Trinickia diaoshuihuensis]